MEKLTTKEFQEKSNIEIIEELMKKNNGYITSKGLENVSFNYERKRTYKESSNRYLY